jgi:hypothetical protein
MEYLQLFTKSFSLSLGKLTIPLVYWQVAAILLIIFIILFAFARLQRSNVNWSFRGALFGVFFGFLLALLLEGFLIIAGKTVFTEIAGWKNAPKPLAHALDAGRERLVEVLGVTDEVPVSYANSSPTSKDAIQVLQSLNPDEMKKVRDLICIP